MARNIHRLTDRQIRNAGKPLNDGGNLWLYPKGNARNWGFRYMLNGRARQMGVGAYPQVSLAEAREIAARYRKILKSGVDPIAQRSKERQHETREASKALTFTQCAARYIRAHRHSWRNRKHARQWVSTLKTYARPVIGEMPVADLAVEDVTRVLSPIWVSKTETAKRVQGRMENIIDWATAQEYRSGANPAQWRGHLDKILPRPTRVKRVRNHPAMPYSDIPWFFRELREEPGVAARALEFLILTAGRTGEVIGARWIELDIDQAVWTIPKDRMKAERQHRVPLSDDALNIITNLPRVNDYVFAGTRYGRPLSNMAILQTMRRMGFGVNGNRGNYVPHGFRSSFRDWCAEDTPYSREVAEAALAHINKNKTEAAYRRTDFLEKRRELMQDWSAFVSPVVTDNIIPIKQHIS